MIQIRIKNKAKLDDIKSSISTILTPIIYPH